MLHLLWLLVFCFAVRGKEIESLVNSNWTNKSAVSHDERSTSDSIFNIISFTRVQCTGASGLQGTCYSRRQCSSLQGTLSGTCAYNLGVCCVIYRSCDSSTNNKVTYFTNPDLPTPSRENLNTFCPLTVSKSNKNICQLRVDFLDFSLAQPDVHGQCVDDYLEVKDGITAVPKICGENNDHHVYVDFHPKNAQIQLNIVTSKSASGIPKWNIKISQIECKSPDQAPSGYLMYFREIEGHVKSFNYPSVSRSSSGTRQLASTNYGVGVQLAPGYCSVEWKQDPKDPYSFTVSGDTDAIDPSELGTATVALSGEDCIADFIVIPNPSQGGTSLTTDRFCGNALLPTATSSKPFVLTVVTGNSETAPDTENRGFSLTYHQIRC